MESSTAPRRATGAATLAEAFRIPAADRASDVAIRTRGDEVTLTWECLRERVDALAGGLAGLGVAKGDTVALLLSNRPEFHVCDLAAVTLAATPFSIYQTFTPEQIGYVVGDAGARVLVTERQHLERVLAARAGLPALEHVIVVDPPPEGPPAGVLALEEVEGADPGFDAEAAAAAVGPDDLVTLIYTSGTTGPPKGVELTHRNLSGVVRSTEDLIEFPPDGRVISWLPAAHIAERTAHHYLPVYFGLQVTCCPNPRDIVGYLRAMLGLDRVLAINVGAAPTPVEVIEFFHAIGLPLAEIWGMSETCGAGAINPPGRIRIGTVGPPVRGVEIRLTEDGEILVRGDVVMAGYRNRPKQTAEALTEDGWLRTGDVGAFDDHGYLRIVDRKKEIIISAAGKNMSRANIEATLKAASPLIGQAV